MEEIMRKNGLSGYFFISILSFSVSTATECPNLSEVDFGPCFMIIGWGWNGDDCVQLGGCGSTDFEGNDYSDYLFGSYQSCMGSCPCLEGYVECFVNPCEVTDCPAYPNATCEADYCGGCNANFYENGELVNDECGEPEACSQESQDSGDVTQDGVIDVLDIVLLINIIMDDSAPSNLELLLSDLNEDGNINVQDCILLINIILSN